MRREEFIEILQNPKLSIRSSSDVLSVSRQYPYFEGARVLTLLALRQSKDPEYPAFLRESSAFIRDRGHLYQILIRPLIEDTKSRIEAKQESDAGDLTQPVAPVEKSEESMAKSAIEPEISGSGSDKIEAIEILQPTATEPIVGSTKADLAPMDNPEIVLETERPSADLQWLEREILSEAVSASILLEASENLKEEPEQPENVLKLEDIDPIRTDRKSEGTAPKSFRDWLNSMDGRTNDAEKKEESVTAPEVKKHSIDELVRAFIRKDPKVAAKSKEFYSPTSMAKMSVLENDEIITETLARIYEKQGNFDKALHAYQVLSLKYPEKKSTFAPLISALKKKLKK